MKLFLSFFLMLSLLMGGEWSYYNNGHKVSLTPLPSKTRSIDLLFFKTPTDQTIGAGKELILKPKDDLCLKKILQQYPHHRSLPTGEIVLSTSSAKESFLLSKKLYQQGCVLFAHPNFLLFPNKRSFDPLFSQQWNLHNYGQDDSMPDIDLNVYEAWQYATGKGVKVAIIDNGFDLAHPDLQQAFTAEKDLIDYDDNASFDNTYEAHGTCCAGLIGARKNGIGIQGIAYDASLIGIKLIGSYADGSDKPLLVSNIVLAFWYAKKFKADVINCSWGTYSVVDAVRNIIDDLAANGRDGKGIPIVFASGNDGRAQWYWANDESALPSTIAVGAVTNLGDLAWYSNYGPALDFVAPSGGGTLAIATDDLTGNLGYADGTFGHPNYCYATDTTGFNGTSAAAPQIAAVIALMLERNPELTRDEIYDILAKTAKKVGNIPYVDGKNDYFGYGLVDAKAAVEEAIRRRVQDDIINRTFPINGYFIQIGKNQFDWVFVHNNLVAKLAGITSSKELLWDPILKNAFTSIDYENSSISFGQAKKSNQLTRLLAGKTFPMAGYFVHYGLGMYDWIFISSSDRCYKLEGLDYRGDFLWIELSLHPLKQKDRVTFRY